MTEKSSKAHAKEVPSIEWDKSVLECYVGIAPDVAENIKNVLDHLKQLESMLAETQKHHTEAYEKLLGCYYAALKLASEREKERDDLKEAFEVLLRRVQYLSEKRHWCFYGYEHKGLDSKLEEIWAWQSPGSIHLLLEKWIEEAKEAL